MSDQPAPTPPNPDPQRLHAAMGRIAEQSQRIMQTFIERQANGPGEFNPLEPGVVSKAYQALWQQMLTDPGRLVEAQVSLWQDYAKLWENTARRMAGEEVEPVATPETGDRRFKDDAWTENPLYDHIKQGYLLASRFMLSTVRETEGLDAHTAHKVDFYTRQFIDALAPTNFAMTNPEVARRTVETGGENLVQGLSNMLEDLERGQGRLRIRMTDLEKFKLGENVAVTPGKVVFDNDLMQLLQYAPTTETVRKRPLLIVPPWINKYYILDLRPKNSFIKWAVDQGHTVFVISWVNPDERLADKTMDDYLLEGPIAALDAIGKATGVSGVNAIGYCLGGTLLAATLAYLKARDTAGPAEPVDIAETEEVVEPSEATEATETAEGAETGVAGDACDTAEVAEAPKDAGGPPVIATEAANDDAMQDPPAASATDRRPAIESATFFTTMVDFEEPGELGVFIDEEQLTLVEESMKEKGYFDGAKMAEAFNLLRANDLIWSFVINNYLMGRTRSRSICCTGTRTRPACRARCTPPTCATCTSTTGSASPAASPSTAFPSISPPSTCRSTSSRPARTTSRRGARPTRRPGSTAVRSASCSRCRDTSPGSSIRPPRTSTATTPASSSPPRKHGSKRQPPARVRGGPTGTPGSACTTAARSRRGSRAPARCRSSRTPPGAT